MQEEYGGNFITVTDEDGNEFELEHLDTIEWNGQTYLAFFPAEQEGEETPEEELGLVILKAIQETARKSSLPWTATRKWMPSMRNS